MTDPEEPHPGEVSRDLFGAPLPAEQFVYFGEILCGEAQIAAGAGAPPLGALLSFAGTIVAVETATVAAEFAADGWAVAAEGAGDPGLIEALLSESGEHIPLLGGELAIRHGEYPLRRGWESSSVLPLTSSWGKRVALTLWIRAA
jgi:hypothetical protein